MTVIDDCMIYIAYAMAVAIRSYCGVADRADACPITEPKKEWRAC
ncbi:MAG: hypothetical protein ACXQTY_03640 [Candidatus Methanogasteraceae archaeon]